MAGDIIQSVIYFVCGYVFSTLAKKYSRSGVVRFILGTILVLGGCVALIVVGERYKTDLISHFTGGSTVTKMVRGGYDMTSAKIQKLVDLILPIPQDEIGLIPIPNDFPKYELEKVRDMDNTISGLVKTKDSIENVNKQVERQLSKLERDFEPKKNEYYALKGAIDSKEEYTSQGRKYTIEEMKARCEALEIEKKEFDSNIQSIKDSIKDSADELLKRNSEIQRLVEERNKFVLATTYKNHIDVEDFISGLDLEGKKGAVRATEQLIDIYNRQANKKPKETEVDDVKSTVDDKESGGAEVAKVYKEFVEGVKNISVVEVDPGKSRPGFSN